ncbi:uncharacterized protein si:ch211-152f22.4 [Conger conger]|uniref:uncharacterized protein si:ch211-152f22.4 n=1 Tax=Conger conger TaxID=82655 RepID=UPI002A59F380|nr:uncharacterized protein si:ch211-152f22.4 [Conger conger]
MPRSIFPTSRRYRGPNSNSRGAPRASRRGGMTDTDRKGGSPHHNASPLVRMVVEDLQPLSTIERAGFRGFVRALNLGHDIPKGISSLRSELLQLYGLVKRDVKASLRSAVDVVLTSETWTRETETYQTVGCHFIDHKWELKSYVLETKELTGRHTEDEIFNQLWTISQEWEIREKIHAVVMNKPNILPPGSGWAYFPCFAYTLDRVFKKALTPANKVLLESYHKAARCLHLESSTTDEPNDSLPPYQLMLSGHIGWTAALNMLEKISIDHNSLDKKGLAYVNNTVSALRLFEDATKDMSQQKYVSVSCIIPLARLLKGKLQEQAQSGNEIAARLGEMLTQHFKDIEMNFKLVASTTLDARFKDSVLTGYSSTDQSRRKLLNKILNLGKASQSTCTTPAPPEECQGGLWKEFDKESACEEELRRYTAKEKIPRNGNPLSWWRSQNDEFPNLKRGARRYLGIVCTCVPPARAFSKAGHVFSLRQLSLEPENINVMLFLNHNGVVAQEA